MADPAFRRPSEFEYQRIAPERACDLGSLIRDWRIILRVNFELRNVFEINKLPPLQILEFCSWWVSCWWNTVFSQLCSQRRQPAGITSSESYFK